MAAATFTPNAVAREASTKGRTITAKQVRSVARATIARFDKTRHPAYQSHVYSAAERTAILAVLRARASGQPAKPAAKPRKAAKPATTATES